MFDKLVGNSNVKTALTRLIKSQRIPNSLLFVGEEGIGKKQFALEIAKSQLCHNPQDFQSCGNCLACNRASNFYRPKPDDKDDFAKVIKSEHADLALVIPYKRFILVDAIRDLEREANFRPYEAKSRFFVVDEAEKMNPQAANALLKTLEEPPETSFIFLITSRPDSLLQTIISRCQIVRLVPIKPSEIEEHLLLTQKYSPDDAALLSKVARGSISRALNTDIGNFCAARESMIRVLESLLINDDRSALLQIAAKINDAKLENDFEAQLETLQTLISDLWNIGIGTPIDKLVNSDIYYELYKLAQSPESKKLQSWQSEIETLRENLKFNLNRKIATGALFMRMADG